MELAIKIAICSLAVVGLCEMLLQIRLALLRKTRKSPCRTCVKNCTVLLDLQDDSADYTEYTLRRAVALAEADPNIPMSIVISKNGLSEENLRICRIFEKKHKSVIVVD